MFNTIGSFSAVYLTLTAVLFILVLFEKYFINLEDKIKAKKAVSKKAVKASAPKKAVRKGNRNMNKCKDNTAAIRRVPNNAA